ncbi:MAG: response regulator [Candidatus Wallbacteria bacterium]|nr:response regulator [Candidatus Wallbacteria bacterium]
MATVGDTGTTKKILVVDDDAGIRGLLRVLFEDEGHKVVEAVNGIEAMQRIDEFVPDLITLDVNMPMMDGFRVCRLLKDGPSTRHVPVLMLTARSEPIALELGSAAGADEYCVKPIRITDLRTRATALLHAAEIRDSEIAATPAAAAVPRPPARANRVAVLAGGAGGLQAMQQIVQRLDRLPSVPVLALFQMPKFAAQLHARQFSKSGRAQFVALEPGMQLKSGTCYLLADEGPRFVLAEDGEGLVAETIENSAESDAPDEELDAPSRRADTLFESAGLVTTGSALGILLSGTGKDGIAGMLAMRQLGGETYAQSERSALVNELPKSALAKGAAGAALEPGEIAAVLGR